MQFGLTVAFFVAVMALVHAQDTPMRQCYSAAYAKCQAGDHQCARNALQSCISSVGGAGSGSDSGSGSGSGSDSGSAPDSSSGMDSSSGSDSS